MKILLAEDTKDMNRVITAALENMGYDVCSCFDGGEALEHALADSFDALVLDIMMPKKDGIEVLKEIRSRNIVTPVLLLTAKTEIEDRVIGLDAGADDYLSKPFAMKELLARVRAMTRRKQEYNTGIIDFGDLSLNGETFELKCENSIRLSVKEFELLQALILNSSRPLSARFILDNIWDNADDATESVVELYIQYLRDKLAAIASLVSIMEADDGYRLVKGNRS
ncbi:MAG: response regulator transcription factor [Lachnospiraceae bacterium]|nr:response regulator transcription factor [Lachnospiraceae bacterium]